MSTHAIFRPPPAVNEPILGFEPGSPERARLQLRLEQMRNERLEIPLVIGGKDVTTGELKQAVMPHDKAHVLADVHQGGAEHVQQAIDAAATRVGGLVALAVGGARHRLPARGRAARRPVARHAARATMLGQSKTAHQAEIDAACESIDFFRFNVEFMLRDLRGAADLVAGHLEPAWSTGRSRASSSRSRRSTSRRSRRT